MFPKKKGIPMQKSLGFHVILFAYTCKYVGGLALSSLKAFELNQQRLGLGPSLNTDALSQKEPFKHSS
ncbi:Uncharacterized protein TCM_000775 [Theobroma cacao]|uniref:Uncharacterized protein n=1 Tax=Theobroma cacao TaxID=3641 RepID=A0A061DII7_THECC|nr:Uncharacterized protein TCM_000775 [Theobroma cacao]